MHGQVSLLCIQWVTAIGQFYQASSILCSRANFLMLSPYLSTNLIAEDNSLKENIWHLFISETFQSYEWRIHNLYSKLWSIGYLASILDLGSRVVALLWLQHLPYTNIDKSHYFACNELSAAIGQFSPASSILCSCGNFSILSPYLSTNLLLNIYAC